MSRGRAVHHRRRQDPRQPANYALACYDPRRPVHRPTHTHPTLSNHQPRHPRDLRTPLQHLPGNIPLSIPPQDRPRPRPPLPRPGNLSPKRPPSPPPPQHLALLSRYGPHFSNGLLRLHSPRHSKHPLPLHAQLPDTPSTAIHQRSPLPLRLLRKLPPLHTHLALHAPPPLPRRIRRRTRMRTSALINRRRAHRERSLRAVPRLLPTTSPSPHPSNRGPRPRSRPRRRNDGVCLGRYARDQRR